MKVNSKKTGKMDTENSLGKMVMYIKVSSKMMPGRAKDR